MLATRYSLMDKYYRFWMPQSYNSKARLNYTNLRKVITDGINLSRGL